MGECLCQLLLCLGCCFLCKKCCESNNPDPQPAQQTVIIQQPQGQPQGPMYDPNNQGQWQQQQSGGYYPAPPPGQWQQPGYPMTQQPGHPGYPSAYPQPGYGPPGAGWNGQPQPNAPVWNPGEFMIGLDRIYEIDCAMIPDSGYPQQQPPPRYS